MKRRHFLQGMGGMMLALPVLEGLAAKGAAATSDPTRFAVFMRQGNGVQQATSDGEPERFWPSFSPGVLTREQLAADTGRAVSVLAEHAASLSILRGVYFNDPSNPCRHSGGGNQALTAARASTDECNTTLALGESLDNRIVRQLGSPGDEPLTLMSGAKTGALDEVLSYRGPRQLRAAERSPFAAYEDIFGLRHLEPAAREQLRTRRKSVNDLVQAELHRLRSRRDLSRADLLSLDLHLSSIRDVERGFGQGLTEPEVALLKAGSSELDDDAHVDEIIKLHIDVMVLAIASGARCAATLQLGPGADMTRYTLDGVLLPSFHEVSHRNTGADAVDVHHRVDRKLLGYFKYLLDRLVEHRLPQGALLDQGVAVYVNDVANKFHEYENVPYLVAGNAGGFLRTGHYLDLGGVTNNKVLNCVGAALGLKNDSGAPLDDFGDPGLPRGFVDAMLA
jgi:Protein of unknown function (DUF1552)